MTDLVSTLQRRRLPLVVGYDLLSWVVGSVVFALLRFGNDADGLTAGEIEWGPLLTVGLAMGLAHVGIAYVTRLHRGRSRTATLEELIQLTAVVFAVSAVSFAVNFHFIWVPRSMPLATGFFVIFLAAAGRAVWRRMKERMDEELHVDGARRVLLVGAGNAAKDLLGSMLRDPAREWRPVGMLDDDPRKRHLRIRRVPVLGTLTDLPVVVEMLNVDAVVIAIPSASVDIIKRVSSAATRAGVEVKVLPHDTQLLTEQVGIRDIRDIDLTDVLGRNQLDTDMSAIAHYLRGRRVLVTGAGGSIGSELCRQINRFDPAELMMLDRDESALHAVQLSIHGHGLLDSDEVILNDIRDIDALREIFVARRPEVVFHAAALKHLPMLEQYPAEAIKTNVIGTQNVLEVACEVGVDRFVNVSTDKAANPCSVLGYSKRLAERVTATMSSQVESGTYLSVRFGNVLGSRGSVLTAFAKQIAGGGPVTVTDPEVTRYFMTIEEACQLVVQAGAIGSPGEALVLDMGEPLKILDVANQLIEQAGRPVEIEFTGLRPGEKMHEELFGDDETEGHRPDHPLVSHVPVPWISHEQIAALPVTGTAAEITAALADCAVLERSRS
ncbi:polysaccharide biosynthesis protein [Nocardioides houyundeii]|uniref:polysaccharide biosynthesis protein n=1 Tax=Nocardioides houyundeii TaxID=2045452 RepID=UPI000DF42C5C|nr:nucleoside-diphosphate sugar epimerase/dehydratase [Nocardioides houyundeii]